jgi:2-polyprenyl-6-methoxyphenol hydroxylase-like FAD-dependent oxidoreductase
MAGIGIVGAGIGGLASAALLARAGHGVTVFDRFEAPRPVGSGLIIQPVGQAVLDLAGAGAAVRALGARIERMVGHEAGHGRCVLDVRYARRGSDSHGLGIHRASLFAALLAAATAAGAQLRSGARVLASTDRPGCRTLTLASGEVAGPFDLVLDASGVHSPLSPLRGRGLAFGALWSTVPWPACDLPKDRLTQRYRRADRMAGILPLGTLPGDATPLAAVFWSLRAADLDRWHQTPLAAWKAEAMAFWPEIGAFLDPIRDPADLSFATYSHGTLRRPFAPRLAILGDAAHRTSPQLGQGANMALLDAAALAQAVATHGPSDAPAEYARLRRWHVRAYQAMSAAFTPQYQSDGWLHPTLRDRLFAPLSRVAPVPLLLNRIACGDLIPPIRGAPRQVRTGRSAAAQLRFSQPQTSEITTLPSPTAEATRLTDPARTSPTA